MGVQVGNVKRINLLGFDTKIVKEVVMVVDNSIELKFTFKENGKPVLRTKTSLESKRISNGDEIYVPKKDFQKAKRIAYAIYKESEEKLKKEKENKARQLNLFESSEK